MILIVVSEIKIYIMSMSVLELFFFSSNFCSLPEKGEKKIKLITWS